MYKRQALNLSGLVRVPVEPPSRFMTYVATLRGAPLTAYAESMLGLLRSEAKAMG